MSGTDECLFIQRSLIKLVDKEGIKGGRDSRGKSRKGLKSAEIKKRQLKTSNNKRRKIRIIESGPTS
jgi:hypothetical protein